VDVDLDATADLDIAPGGVFSALEDLASYPHWLTIVGAATPAPAHADDTGPAWFVELVGRVGPFTKTKRVRMVRTGHAPADGTVRFERVEHDGRTHNVWVLTGQATPTAPGRTKVHVHLHYGGGRSLPGADLLLRQEANKAGERLQRHLQR
jgi:hypothetical protein